MQNIRSEGLRCSRGGRRGRAMGRVTCAVQENAKDLVMGMTETSLFNLFVQPGPASLSQELAISFQVYDTYFYGFLKS